MLHKKHSPRHSSASLVALQQLHVPSPSHGSISCQSSSEHRPNKALFPTQPPTHKETSLLEHLPVGPLVRLALDFNRLVPGPHVVDEGVVLGLGGVELGELIRLVVRRHIEGWQCLLPADDEGALHDAVVRLAIDGGAAEYVLARSFETGEETPWRRAC